MKARRKVPPVRAGFSQLHWMQKLARGGLSDGADPLRRVTLAELRLHNTRHDAWLAVRGRVYDVTEYLSFHPGGVEEVLRAAGDDATELFDEVHRWVNVEGMLGPLCVGVLDETAREAEAEGALHPSEWRQLTVVETRPAGEDSKLLRFGLEPSQQLGLHVGEHLQLRVRRKGVSTKAESVIRSYTPVSLPSTRGSFELLVRRAEGGVASPALYDAAVGDAFDARGPRGHRVYGTYGASTFRLPLLPEAHAAHVVMVSAGSGVAPSVALLRALAAAASSLPLTLIHSSRDEAHVPALAEILPLVGSLPQAALRLALSEAASGRDDAPDGPGAARVCRAGRLTKDLFMQWAPAADKSVLVFICGPPVFNMEVAAWASDAGHAETNVHIF